MINFFSTGKLNCAAFTAGIIEAVLNGANFVRYLFISAIYFIVTLDKTITGNILILPKVFMNSAVKHLYFH